MKILGYTFEIEEKDTSDDIGAFETCKHEKWFEYKERMWEDPGVAYSWMEVYVKCLKCGKTIPKRYLKCQKVQMNPQQ